MGSVRNQPLRIALLFELRLVTLQQPMQGIAEYARSHGPWTFYMAGMGDITAAELIEQHSFDGIIADLSPIPANHEFQKIAKAVSLPMVAMLGQPPDCTKPLVLPDDEQIGASAARHLIERGFKQFAFVGFAGTQFSDDRLHGYRQVVEAAKHQCFVYEGLGRSWGEYHFEWERDELSQWIATLPKPVGILGCTDIRGRHVLQSCARVGLHVPEEAAVLGVDNEESLCEVLDPPMSSVPLDGRTIGYEAAALLDRLMAGQAPPDRPVRVPPLPIVVRRSSDGYAISDPDVAEAMRYIWSHADQPISVDDVLSAVAVSRRALELRFRRALDRTLQKEIWRAHCDQAKRLLANTDLQMEKIAAACGFLSTDRLHVVFSREVGRTPSLYRRQTRRALSSDTNSVADDSRPTS